MVDPTELFCSVDDFWKSFEEKWRAALLSQSSAVIPTRVPSLSSSEAMTIVLMFHLSGYRCFKHFYKGFILGYLHDLFPKSPSYQQYLELRKRVVFPLHCYLLTRMGVCTDISFIDSTALPVCNVRRIARHRLFKKAARRGKTSVGWFFGFKLHVVISSDSEFLGLMLTSGNVDDRKPVPSLVSELTGKLFGDRGYISTKLVTELLHNGLHLITRLRKGMKNRLMTLADKAFLAKRGLIETVFGLLKADHNLQHTRHRSLHGFLINLWGALIAYTHRPTKPQISWPHTEQALIRRT